MPSVFNLARNELSYRQYFLRQDVHTFSVFAGGFIAVFLLLIMADYALWKDGWVFYGLLALRISFVALALIAIIRSMTTVVPAVFDRWAFALGMYIALTNILVILSRPSGYLHSIIGELVCIVVLFATMPDRLWYRTLPPVILSAGSLICFFSVKGRLGFVADLTVVLSFLVANVLGIRIANAYYSFRRESFFSAEEIKSLYQDTRDSEKQYQLLVQNSHGIIYTIGSDGLLSFVSPSWTKMLGHDPSEVVGRDFRTFVHLEDIPSCEVFLNKTVETGEIQQGAVYRVLHSDRSYRWHRSNIVPCFNERNEIISFVGNAVDITEQVQREAELVEARIAADTANQAKSEFLALVSHEIRTPLNAMVGFSSLAKTTSSPAVLRDYLEVIENSARTLMGLINNILDMSKIEANRIVLEAIPVNLRELLGMLATDYLLENAGKPLEFIFRLDDDVPEWVLTDPLRLRQILTNLLGNAFKFTPQGAVTLEVNCIGEPLDDGIVILLFSIQDTGIGIPEDKQSLLFEPFRQLDPSISRKYGGTGLGLAIVRRLVLLMGGDITVSSREGAGSTFVVKLPLQPSVAPVDQSRAGKREINAVLSVLVVEDNNANRRLMHDTLTVWGHSITLAIDGNEAIAHVASKPFDLILMDLRMPGLDGIEASRRIRILEKKAGRDRTPIIAVTADTDVSTQEACRLAGIDAVLAKPAPLDKLAALLAEHATGLPVMTSVIISSDNTFMLSDQSLRDMGYDVERNREYAALLLTDIEEEMQHLVTALQTQDRQRLGLTAHTLKGLCAHLRDPLPKDLAHRLQTETASSSLSDLRETVNHLQDAINKVIAQRRQQESI